MGYLSQGTQYTLSPATPALPLGLLPRSGTTALACPPFSFSSLLVWWRPASFSSISTLLAVLLETCASDDGGHKWPGPLACQSPPGSDHSTISWGKCTMILGELWATVTHGGHPGYCGPPPQAFPHIAHHEPEVALPITAPPQWTSIPQISQPGQSSPSPVTISQPGQSSPSPVTFSRSQWLLVETVNRMEALTSQAPPSGHRSSPGVPPKLNQGSCHQEPLGPRRVPASPSRCQGRAHGSSFGLSGVSVTLPVPHGGLFFSRISPPQQSRTSLAAPLLRFPISRRLLVKFDSFSFIVWSQTCMPSGKTAHRFPFNCMNYM